ncbi:MAG: galactokinase [Marmoricola sp.]|nr:galactokinase [Marmoricola sp.]
MDTLAADFADRFGSDPDGIWAAPGRVNLIGEHTDYNDGFVLPIALPHLTRAAVALRPDGRIRLASLQAPDGFDGAAPTPGSVPGWSRYVAGVGWAFGEAGHRVPGLDVLIDSNVPVGAGLSSSAALECSVALALSDGLGLALSRAELAHLAQRAENDFAGVPTGLLDQTASLGCTAEHALFLDVRSGAVEQVPFDVRRNGLALLVINTLAHHDLADGQYAARRKSCEEAARRLGVPFLRDATLDDLGRLDGELLQRARHIVTENQRVLDVVDLLHQGAVAGIGPLLTASHASLRDDYEVSCAELDAAVDAALRAGALGARMTGGGFGGSAIALVPVGSVSLVEDAVADAFSKKGFRAPECFTVEAGPGAHRQHV